MPNTAPDRAQVIHDGPCDILREGAISLTAAAKSLPLIDGRGPNPATVWRWARQGIGGVFLEYVRIGRRIVTSRAALGRFVAALAAADRPIGSGSNPSIAKTRSEAQRQKAVAEAGARLAAAGI
jgi:hypothetical protein